MENGRLEENKTEPKNQLLFAAITTAAFLILLYASVFKGIPMGINVEIFILVCYLSMFTFFERFRAAVEQSVFQTVAVLLLGVTFMLYNDLILLAINGFLIVVLLGAQYRFMLKKQSDSMVSFQAIKDAAVVWFGYTFGGMKGAFQSFGKNKKVNGIKGVIIGVAITVPVLAAVIALLMSADFAFSDMLKNTFKNVAAGDIVGYSIAGILLFVCASGLYYSLSSRNPAAPLKQRKTLHFNNIAAMLLAGCMDAVLAVFGAVQFAYLFAGNVPAGYTWAMYAQSGFWQLVAVAVIVIAIVLIMRKSAEVRAGGTGIKTMLSLLCLLTEIILVSAFWRMALYEQAYSYSILRVFTQAFMVATAGVFVVLILSLWKPDIKLKKWIFIVGMVCYLGLNFMNADAFIAQQNSAIGKDRTDVKYMTQLSVDAMPYYVDKVDAEIKKILDENYGYNDVIQDNQDYLINSFDRIKVETDKADGWQYFNVSRENAKQILTKDQEDIDQAKKKVNALRQQYLKVKSNELREQNLNAHLN